MCNLFLNGMPIYILVIFYAENDTPIGTEIPSTPFRAYEFTRKYIEIIRENPFNGTQIILDIADQHNEIINRVCVYVALPYMDLEQLITYVHNYNDLIQRIYVVNIDEIPEQTKVAIAELTNNMRRTYTELLQLYFTVSLFELRKCATVDKSQSWFGTPVNAATEPSTSDKTPVDVTTESAVDFDMQCSMMNTFARVENAVLSNYTSNNLVGDAAGAIASTHTLSPELSAEFIGAFAKNNGNNQLNVFFFNLI